MIGLVVDGFGDFKNASKEKMCKYAALRINTLPIVCGLRSCMKARDVLLFNLNDYRPVLLNTILMM